MNAATGDTVLQAAARGYSRTRSHPDSGARPVKPDSGTSDWAIQDGWKDRRFATEAHATHVGDNQRAVKRDHRRWFKDQLTQRATQKRKEDGQALLSELATDFGFAWADVARLIGVSVPAIRKWRMSGGISGENVARLADLVAFVEILREKTSVTSPAAWFNTPLVPGYTVTPKHLYSLETGPALLDYVEGNVNVATMLAEIAPAWEDDYDAHGYVVRKFEDGSFGIVRNG